MQVQERTIGADGLGPAYGDAVGLSQNEKLAIIGGGFATAGVGLWFLLSWVEGRGRRRRRSRRA